MSLIILLMKKLGQIVRNSKGLSMMELLIGGVIMAGIGVAAVQLNSQMTKQNKLNENSAFQLADNADLSTRIAKIFENAGVSQYFLHLPIRITGCADNDPCVRSYSAADKKFENLSSNPFSSEVSGNYVEFFRDADGELTIDDVNVEDSNGIIEQVQLTHTPEFYWSMGADKYYTTWPLVDENSKAFTIMERIFPDEYFEMFMPAAYSSAGNDSFVRSKTKVFDSSQLKNRFAVVFASGNLKHYMIKELTDSFYCFNPDDDSSTIGLTDHRAACNSQNNLLANKVDAVDLPYHHFMKFEKVNVAGDDFINQFIPDIPNSGQWGSQDSNYYMFPTEYYSLTQGASSKIDLQPVSPGGVVPRRIGHFFHTGIGLKNMMLVVMPVSFRSFYLVNEGKTCKDKGQNEIPYYKLMERKFLKRGDVRETVLKNFVTDPVYFGREIGTNSLELIFGNDRCVTGMNG